MTDRPLRIGLAGLGTIGGQVARLLVRRTNVLAERCGRPLSLVAVSAKDTSKVSDLDLSPFQRLEDPAGLAALDAVDVVVELMGGAEGAARTLVTNALRQGKAVVTANKALIAHHGTELAALAEQTGAAFAFEASVAGGVPVIKTLRESLIVNDVNRVYGILNGTCNFILTEMAKGKGDFPTVLKEAQRLGFAEADPTFDIEGTDSAHKLAILSALAFGTTIDFKGVFCEGITRISQVDFEFAREFGYAIKLLAIAEATEEGVRQHVHLAMVPQGAAIAAVDGPFNAVVIEGDPIGRLVLEGPGAGAGPTASAVLGDLADIARGAVRPMFVKPVGALRKAGGATLASRVGRFYLRLPALDRPGVIAEIAGILARHEISIESMIQRGRDPGAQVQIVMIIHESREQVVTQALSDIAGLASVTEAPCMIRIEAF